MTPDLTQRLNSKTKKSTYLTTTYYFGELKKGGNQQLMNVDY